MSEEETGNSVQELAESARHGVVKISSGAAARTVVELSTSVFLARLLEPREFGIVAIVATFLGLSFVVGNLGVGIAVVQAKSLDARARSTAFFISTAVGLFFTLVLSAISPIAARFFAMPILRVAMPIMSLQLLLSGCAATALGLLRRNLLFGRAAVADIVSSLSYGVASIGFALAGFGVWSLVWAPVVAGLTLWILAHALSGFVPRFEFSREAAKSLIAYGGTLTFKNLFVHIARHADKFIIGKLLGAHATGLYARAFNWGSIPDMRLMPVLHVVCFSVFCRLQDDRRRFVEWYIKVARLSAIAMVPLALGLIVLAEHFTVALFGEKWLDIVPALRILSFAGLLNSLHRLGGAAIEATGKLRYEVWNQAIYAILLPIGALVAIPYGIVGVSFAVLACSVVLFLLKGIALRLTIGLRLRQYLGIPLPALAAGFAMAGVVYGLFTHPALLGPAQSTQGHWLRLVLGSFCGATSYALFLYIAARDELLLAFDQLSRLRIKAVGRGGRRAPSRLVPGLFVVQGRLPYAESDRRGLYEAYARSVPVLHLEPALLPWSWRGMFRRQQPFPEGVAPPGIHVLEMQPLVPGSRRPAIASFNRWVAVRSLLRYLRNGTGGEVVLLTLTPGLFGTFRGLPAFRVYDVWDDYPGLAKDQRTRRRVSRAHLRFLRDCDLVRATSRVLVEAIRPHRPDVVEITNGVDYLAFSEGVNLSTPESIGRVARPRVGLVGRLNDRVDWQLLEDLCRLRAEWNVVVVGPLYEAGDETLTALERLSEVANFFHLPAVPEKELAVYISALDVCLIPYHPSGSNLSVNPLKLYQYLAAGKPVVATRLPGLVEFEDVVHCRERPGEFIEEIEACLLSRGETKLIQRRQQRAREFDWQVIADRDLAVLQRRLSPDTEQLVS